MLKYIHSLFFIENEEEKILKKYDVLTIDEVLKKYNSVEDFQWLVLNEYITPYKNCPYLRRQFSGSKLEFEKFKYTFQNGFSIEKIDGSIYKGKIFIENIDMDIAEDVLNFGKNNNLNLNFIFDLSKFNGDLNEFEKNIIWYKLHSLDDQISIFNVSEKFGILGLEIIKKYNYSSFDSWLE
uniref:Uncharacterized protein n=1 Tax=viral metagenome TaxID=1070528 RepID=A0A6C0AEG4_9ZZZZ